MRYEIWSNTDSRRDRFFTGYAAGDRMKRSWEGRVEPEKPTEDNVDAQLNHLWMMFNADDRPNGQTAHSLSIGDVIVLEGEAYAVATMGFTKLEDFAPVIGDYER